MKTSTRLMLSVSVIAMAAVPVPSAMAQEAAVEEVLIVGSRSQKPRSVTDSPVPIDVLSAEQFNVGGNSADITDNLKALVPSFTATPATGDGSAFVRPTSLRGMSSDQSLVLVNGKRRHRSALVTIFAPAGGNGAHAPDIGMIPSIALKRVEVLRDGASSQYGSDAIAGVINFVLDDSNEGGSVVAQYGQFYKGEQSYKVSANVGLPLGDTGFVNISAEYVDNEALSRGFVDDRALGLIAGGVTGVGEDTPFGDAPKVQSWGRPETSGARLFVNAGVELSDSSEVYLHGNYAETDGRYRFFFRGPDHSTITSLEDDFGWESTLPAGFTPFLDGSQTDVSVVGGLKGELENGLFYDFSAGYGKNSLDYFLNNTLNGQLDPQGGQPQRDFDVGGYDQEEINLNADFSYALSDSFNLAFGGEFRKEIFSLVSGEPNAAVGAGTSGFTGIKINESFSRQNISVYVDVEQDISDEFMMQYAVRYEDFSDFGGTINGKIAGRYSVSDALALRGAISTGFHAPTPGQSNLTSVVTTFNSGEQVEERLVTPADPDAVLLGGIPLTEEKSINYSFGFSSSFGGSTTLTVDFYQIDVDDKIYRTGNLQVVGGVPGDVISFYTNALDTRSKGVDIVLASEIEWSGDARTDLSFAFNYNKYSITGQKSIETIDGPVLPVGTDILDDIQNAFPNTRFVLLTDTYFGDQWNFMARANFYGSHVDEKGSQGGGGDGFSTELGSSVFFDLELGYQVNENLKIVAGAVNVFNSFAPETGLNNSSYRGNGLQYPRWSAANYEGGSWYLRLGYKF